MGKQRAAFRKDYTQVIKHSNGKYPFSMGNTSSKGSFSIAMLVYQRVPQLCVVQIYNCNHLEFNEFQ